jgi:hypothetical protein
MMIPNDLMPPPTTVRRIAYVDSPDQHLPRVPRQPQIEVPAAQYIDELRAFSGLKTLLDQGDPS